MAAEPPGKAYERALETVTPKLKLKWEPQEIGDNMTGSETWPSREAIWVTGVGLSPLNLTLSPEHGI